MAEKRKRVVLGFQEKLEIIKRIRKGETASSIAQIYGVGRTTVNDVKRNAEKIEQHVSKLLSTNGDISTRKTMKQAKFEQLDNAMYQWYVESRSQGILISDSLIMTKAIEMNQKMEGSPEFKATKGWLDKFKYRHGIRQTENGREKPPTANEIKRKAERIQQQMSRMLSADVEAVNRRNIKSAKFEQLDNAMYQWFIQAKSRGTPLSGPIIMNKAVEMNKKLQGCPNFKASIGWLKKFKFRHGIRRLDISGEKLPTFDIKRSPEKNEERNDKTSKFDQLDNAMYQWFIQARSRGMPISGPVIMTKAVEMNQKLDGDPDFKASIGWLDKFKSRHGIRLIDISGKKPNNNNILIADLISQLNFKISKLNMVREQIYNCDETGIYWKALPQKILASVSDKTDPEQKDRITAMVCANATGNHKLPVLVIGKYEKPFKNINPNALPVSYFAQKSAWMDQAIFTKWFHTVFVPEVRRHLAGKQLPQEALLLMDSAPTHPSCELQSDDGKIVCFFLPVNPSIQPMEQNIIENLKQCYRKSFIEHLLFSDNDMAVKKIYRKYDLKDAIFNIASAWADMQVSNLKKAWTKLWSESVHQTEEIISVDDIVKLCNNSRLNSDKMTPEDVREWLECDKADGGFEVLSDDEIVSNVTATEEDEESDGEEGSVLIPKPSTSHSEAETMVSKVINWFEMQDEANVSEILLLYKIRNMAAQKASKTQEMTF